MKPAINDNGPLAGRAGAGRLEQGIEKDRTNVSNFNSARQAALQAATQQNGNTPRAPAPANRQEIYLQAGSRPEYLEMTRIALFHAGGIFQRGGALVRVVRYDRRKKR